MVINRSELDKNNSQTLAINLVTFTRPAFALLTLFRVKAAIYLIIWSVYL